MAAWLGRAEPLGDLLCRLVFLGSKPLRWQTAPRWRHRLSPGAVARQSRSASDHLGALALGPPKPDRPSPWTRARRQSGDILSQERVTIGPDDAAIPYRRSTETARSQIVRWPPTSPTGGPNAGRRTPARANAWRKRVGRSTAGSIGACRPPPTTTWCGLDHPMSARIATGGTANARSGGRNRPTRGGGQSRAGQGVLARDGHAVVVKCGDAGRCLVEHDLDPLPQPEITYDARILAVAPTPTTKPWAAAARCCATAPKAMKFTGSSRRGWTCWAVFLSQMSASPGAKRNRRRRQGLWLCRCSCVGISRRIPDTVPQAKTNRGPGPHRALSRA